MTFSFPKTTRRVLSSWKIRCVVNYCRFNDQCCHWSRQRRLLGNSSPALLRSWTDQYANHMLYHFKYSHHTDQPCIFSPARSDQFPTMQSQPITKAASSSCVGCFGEVQQNEGRRTPRVSCSVLTHLNHKCSDLPSSHLSCYQRSYFLQMQQRPSGCSNIICS